MMLLFLFAVLFFFAVSLLVLSLIGLGVWVVGSGITRKDAPDAKTQVIWLLAVALAVLLLSPVLTFLSLWWMYRLTA